VLLDGNGKLPTIIVSQQFVSLAWRGQEKGKEEAQDASLDRRWKSRWSFLGKQNKLECARGEVLTEVGSIWKIQERGWSQPG